MTINVTIAGETVPACDDKPIFDPDAFRLTDQERELTTLARNVAAAKFAPRAGDYDREATFPTQNYRDMHEAGLLGICVPKEDGGHGAPFRTYMMTAAEIGRYCGATALTWNMHVCSCLWTGALTDDLDMGAEDRELHRSAGRCTTSGSWKRARSTRSPSRKVVRRRPEPRPSPPPQGASTAAS